MKALAGRSLVAAALWSLASTGAMAQAPQVPASDVTVRSVKAVGYQVGGGDTTIDLKGTTLGAGAVGEAKVEAKTGGDHGRGQAQRARGRPRRWVPSSWPT